MTSSDRLLDHDDDLALAIDAWLPTSNQAARHDILALLEQVASSGADPIAQLQDGVNRWFGARAAAALPPRTTRSTQQARATLMLEPLYPLRRPTLWPQRPKRLPDELFSSWLWRAAIAANVPPRVFVKQVVGAELGDVDRTIGEIAVRRLAQVTGQTMGHLAAGLLQIMPAATYDAPSTLIENVVLADERYLLARGGTDRLGRPKPVLQYCPACLASDARPYFRRSWRLAHVVACSEHGCRLRDRCWQCDRPISLLSQRTTSPIPRCPFCDAVFGNATAVASPGRRRQAALQALLQYLAIRVPAAHRVRHLDALQRQFGSMVRARVTDRETIIAGLLPASVMTWFGRPADGRHAENLQMLAEGLNPDSLPAAAHHTRRKTRRSLTPTHAARMNGSQPEGGRRVLPDYSETARTLTWTLIEDQRARMAASAAQGVQSADQNR